MKIPKRTTALAFNGISKTLEVAEHPVGSSAGRILWLVSPLHLPGWSILFSSDKSKDLVLRHLVLKMLLKRLNKNEEVVFKCLLVGLPEPEYKILEGVFTSPKNSNLGPRVLLEFIRHQFLGIVDPIRQLPSYEPQLVIQKIWTEKRRLPPERFIGVGYTDQGHLSTVPSWKDQIILNGEETPKLGVLLYSIKKILSWVPSRTPPSRETVRLKSSRKSETGK